MRFVVPALIALVLISSGCVSDDQNPGTNPGVDKFSYSSDGRTYTASLFPGYSDSMEWMSRNLPQDAVITAWWDYGHMIRGLGEREAVGFNPSEESLHTVAMVAAGGEFDTESLGELSDHGDIEMVAMALTTTDPSEMIAIMQAYHSDYIMVSRNDRTISWIIYDISAVEAEQLDEYTFVNDNSMMYRMLAHDDIRDMDMLYSDSAVVIYRIVK
jgi:asparagine N-glycosylation enzyme membrane subunit Stt3